MPVGAMGAMYRGRKAIALDAAGLQPAVQSGPVVVKAVSSSRGHSDAIVPRSPAASGENVRQMEDAL